MITHLERILFAALCGFLFPLAIRADADTPRGVSGGKDILPGRAVARPSLEHVHAWEGKSSYVVDSWQTEQGLPRNDVLSMTQTADGYLWLGTSYGLARFDGIRFTVFDHANTPEMVKGRIVSLLSDRQGRLWMASDLGELTFLERGLFHHVDKPSSGEINCLAEDDEGRIWVGAGNGLCRVDAGQVLPFLLERNTKKPVRRLKFDPVRKVLWFDQDGIVNALQKEKFMETKRSGTNWVVDVNTMALGRGGGLWIVDMGRRLGRTLEDNSFTATQALPIGSEGWIAPLLEDRRGNLWMSVGGHGIYRLGTDGAFESFSTSSGMKDQNVASILEDAEGNIWVGTHNGGLHRFKRRTFRVYDADDGLLDMTVFSVSANPAGLVHLSTRGGQSYSVEGGRVSSVMLGTTHTLAFDSSGSLWGNWFGGRLTGYRPEGDRFQVRVRTEDPLFNRCTAIVGDREGRVWFGGHFGLGCYHNGSFEDWSGVAKVPPIWVRALAVGPDGTLWIGTFGGGLYSLHHGQLRSFRKQDGLPSDTIQSLFVDSNGAVWIGTSGDGLVRFFEGRFAKCSTLDGLADNAICGIIEDDHGELWMSSFRGVFRVSRKELERFANGQQKSIRCFSYGTRDGLASAECTAESQPNTCKTPDGRLWFATGKGLAVVDPSQIELNTNAPPVVIEELVIDDQVQRLSIGGRNPDEPVVIPAGVQRVELRYTGLSFVSPEQVQFQYRLEGHEPTWVHAGSRRTAYYTKVPPGQYRFRAKAANNNGVWNEAGAAISLRFMPHFWQTWWFASAALLTSVGVVAGVVRHFAVQKLRQQLILAEHQRALESERARIAQDMHDQLGSHLTRIGLLSEIVNQHHVPDTRLEAHFQGIAGIARELAREMDQVVWAVNPKKDTLEDLASYCCSYAEEFFALTSISCRIDLPDDLPDLSFSSKTRYQFFLAFKEALNNAAKHARATEVVLRWSLTAQSLVLSVEDNGKGFDTSRVTGGRNGMSNMASRMTAIMGRVEILSAPGAGTQIRFEVPRGEHPSAPPSVGSKSRIDL